MIATNSHMSGALQHQRQATLAAQADHAHLVREARAARRVQRRDARGTGVWYLRLNVLASLAQRSHTDAGIRSRNATVIVAIQQHA